MAPLTPALFDDASQNLPHRMMAAVANIYYGEWKFSKNGVFG